MCNPTTAASQNTAKAKQSLTHQQKYQPAAPKSQPQYAFCQSKAEKLNHFSL
jgi:hypothetical protein